MINREHDLPITKQALILRISRGSVYYLTRPMPEADLAIMRRLDRLHLEFPFAGSRMLQGLLVAATTSTRSLLGIASNRSRAMPGDRTRATTASSTLNSFGEVACRIGETGKNNARDRFRAGGALARIGVAAPFHSHQGGLAILFVQGDRCTASRSAR
jgi:hypothetical protein